MTGLACCGLGYVKKEPELFDNDESIFNPELINKEDYD
jgi:hypothetical protein